MIKKNHWCKSQKKITWYIITYIIMSHHSTLYKSIYHSYKTKLEIKTLKCIFPFIIQWTPFLVKLYDIKFYTKLWTPKFTSLKCGHEHVFSGLNQINQHFIWWFIAHIVSFDWSQIGVRYTRESWQADYLTFRALQKTKSLLWWRQFSTQADSRGISSFFESCSNNVSTWSNNFSMIQWSWQENWCYEDSRSSTTGRT